MIRAVLLALAAAAPAAPAPARTAALPGQELELRTVDGWTLRAAWLRARGDKATVVLLHGTGQRKEYWKPFARALARAGYGYIAVDLRGHGDSRVTPAGETITYRKLRASKAANDYEDMTRDVEAAVSTLTANGVPEETIGVMGAEVGGSIAVKYAAVHPEVPFVVVLSPGLAWQEIPLVNAVRAFKGRRTPILMVHSEADRRSSKETPLLYAFARNAVGEGDATLIVVPAERGTRMLAKNPGLTARLLAWIENPAAPAPPAASAEAAPAASTAPAAPAALGPGAEPE